MLKALYVKLNAEWKSFYIFIFLDCIAKILETDYSYKRLLAMLILAQIQVSCVTLSIDPICIRKIPMRVYYITNILQTGLSISYIRYRNTVIFIVYFRHLIQNILVNIVIWSWKNINSKIVNYFIQNKWIIYSTY